MKIGILLTDEPDKAQVDKYGDYYDMFQKLFNSVEDNHTFIPYQITNNIYPNNIDECDAYLITGSKYSVYDGFEWIDILKEYIKKLFQQEKKLIGICYGHQIIAEALGGKVIKSDKGWGVGIKESKTVQKKSWMSPYQDVISLRYSHQDQVTTLPKGSELITTNEFCPNAGYQIDNVILTLQGHPEYSSEFLEFLMTKRIKGIGESTHQQAISSLQQTTDDKLIAKWILNFIRK